MNITYNGFEEAMRRFDLVVYWDRDAGELDLIGHGRIACIDTEERNIFSVNETALENYSPKDATTIRTLCSGLARTALEKREL